MAKSRSEAARRRKLMAEAEAAVNEPDDLVEDQPNAVAADHDGLLLTVCWGEEKFTPVKQSYSTFTIGPFTASVQVPPRADMRAVVQRVSEQLEALAAEQFEQKLDAFMRRLRRATSEGARR